jgi:hypothetical protein
MRWVFTAFCLLGFVMSSAEAKRVKTPKSANARAMAETHKSHGKHAGQKVKVRKKREKYN